MKKNGIITLLALTAVLFLMGCKQATTADVWTELTPANIETEIAKYDGNFKGTMDGQEGFLVIDAKAKEVGMSNTLDQAKAEKIDIAIWLTATIDTNGKVEGNGGSKIKLTLKVETQTIEVILTKF